ncbi:hypothetical protein Q0N88_32815, partial [Bacillus thuringiensis]
LVIIPVNPSFLEMVWITIILPEKRISLCIYFWIFMSFATPSKKKKAQNILIVIIFLVINIAITLATTLLGKLAPAFQVLRRVEYHGESKSLFINMFQENGFNIFNISFMVMVSALIIYVIAYIIDKKLEV